MSVAFTATAAAPLRCEASRSSRRRASSSSSSTRLPRCIAIANLEKNIHTSAPPAANNNPPSNPVSRRHALTGVLGGGVAAALSSSAAALLLLPCSPALAITDAPVGDLANTAPLKAATLGSSGDDGWTLLESGVAFKVDVVGEGDVPRGILDTVDHYVPNPFVVVNYNVYWASDGKCIASTTAARRPYNYQAGVKDEVQDEPGGVMGMKVGERRRFVVPPELRFKRKVFGQLVLPPRDDYLLLDVELMALQPY